MPLANLFDMERSLEAEAIGLGQARYAFRAEHEEEKTEPAKELMRRMIPPLASAIQEFLDDALDGKPGPGAGLAKFLTMFDPADIAFITARQVLLAFGRANKLVPNALAISRNLENAAASEELKKADPKGFMRLQTKIERTRLEGQRFVLVRKAEEKAQVTRISWGISERARVGQLLIDLCERTCGMFETAIAYEGHKKYSVIRPYDETMEELDKAHTRCSLLSPHHLPMVVPPKPWTTPYNGGYLDGRGMRVRLLNSRRVNKNYMAEFAQDSNMMVYRAVNALQATPWRINTAVLNVLREVWDSGLDIASMPSRDPLPMPVCPWGEGVPPSEKALGDHRANRARTYEANEQMITKRRSIQAQLWVGDKMKDFEAIYFPHVIDWRGRMYPVPAFVNPQSDDMGKAMLEFANGAALGPDGAYFLAIHGANCYGIDKVPFAERIKWVEDNQDAIMAAAFDPLANKWWAEADAPWMFLAFCKEWAGLCAHVAHGASQETFVSHLPVSWDGSCNGLQNFSAMLRDPVGGAATNLVPSNTPADIYQRVADVASKQVERDAVSGEVNARYWLGKVTRKIAKRPTMTLPYGSGRYGFRDQLREELDKYKRENRENYLMGDEFLCSLYMANVMYDALGEVVVAARHAMDWLQKVAQVASEEGLPIWWTTPAGMRVMQEYRVADAQVINCNLGTRRIVLQVSVDGEELNKRKQAQGISPNFVHSLDAAHLMRTIGLCLDAGITSLAMVHDSYGTHAGNAGLLRDLLREAFVQQYSMNTLQEFRDEVAQQLSPELRAKLPPVPAMGTLDLEGVLTSEYFFA